MSSMKTVIILINSLKHGGAEKQALMLFDNLPSHVEKKLIVLSKVEKTQLATRSSVISINLGILRFGYSLLQIIIMPGKKYFFGYLFKSNLYAVTLGLLCPTSDVWIGFRSSTLDKRKLLGIKLLSFFSNGIIANSHRGKDYLINSGIKNRNIIVIPNGIKITLKRNYRYDIEQTFKILNISRFIKSKNIELYLRLAEDFKDDETMKFMLCGYGELFDEYKNYVSDQNLSNVEFFESSMAQQCLQQADILVSTSLIEGFSNVILEAMEAGVPVIASDAGDNRILLDDKCGIYLPSCTLQNFKSAVINLRGDRAEYELLSNRARLRVEQNYSVGAMVKNYTRLLE